MQTTFQELRNFRGETAQHRVGYVKDVLFSNMTQAILFLKMGMHRWALGRYGLIPYQAVDGISIPEQTIKLNFDDEELDSLAKTYSSEWYEELFSGFRNDTEEHDAISYRQQQRVRVGTEPMLFRCSDLMDYGLQASDGLVGFVDDLLINIEQGTVPFMVIGRRTAVSTTYFLCPYFAVREYNEALRTMYSPLTRADFSAIPLFDIKEYSEAVELRIWRLYVTLMRKREHAVAPFEPSVRRSS